MAITAVAPGRDYRWWVGGDGNAWANIEGIGVMNLGKATMALSNPGEALGLDASKEISDPNPQPSNNQAQNAQASAGDYYGYGGTSSGGNYSSGSSGGTGTYSTYNAEEEARKQNMRNTYDAQIGDINQNLGLLGSQLDNELAGVRGEYDQYRNEQQSDYNAQRNSYDNSTKQNQQNLQSNRNDINDRASSGLRGLLRILGSMGAGGGSVARYEAPGMVTSQANRELSNAGKTYAQNQSNLDTEWGNYQNQHENDKKKLEDWYNGQVKSKQQANEEKRQSLLANLVDAYSNRQQYGGDFNANIKDAYNQIAESRNRATNLGQFSTPNYTGSTAVFKSPELSSYSADNSNLTTAVSESNTSSGSPLLAILSGNDKKKDLMGA